MSQDPAWIPCDQCDNFICTHHKMHAHDCPCPVLETWLEHDLNPYDDPRPGDNVIGVLSDDE